MIGLPLAAGAAHETFSVEPVFVDTASDVGAEGAAGTKMLAEAEAALKPSVFAALTRK